MKNLPYFRWYPADAETDAAYSAMNWSERGFYHWCLNYSWINNGLPLDLDELARAARIGRRELNRLWDRVGQRFTSASGVWRNARQETERAHAITKSERNSAAVRTRYGRSTNVPTNEPQHAPARADCGCDSVVKEFPQGESEGKTEPPPPPLACQSEYPLTTAELRRRDPAADEFFTLRLVQQVTQHLLSDGKFPPAQLDAATTDRAITAACRESYDTGPPGHRLGLLLSRVPKILVTWGIESETEKHGQTR